MYKRILFVYLCVLMFVPHLAFALEEISLFSTEITINKDATFDVVERISYDFGNAERHGIFRYIPTEHEDPASNILSDRYIDIVDISVLMDRNEVPFTVEDQSNRVFVRIGDPNATISGPHEYEISYTVNGGLSYPAAGYELYWDITGDEWPVLIERAEARVIDPDGVFNNARACYVGPDGVGRSCASTVTDGNATVFAANNLEPGHGFTIAQALDGSVTKVILERPNTLLLIAIGLPLLLIFLVYRAYRFMTAHKPDRTIIPQYEPYQDFKPMYTGVLLDGNLDAKDITAGFVYLAQLGFLRIKKIDKKFLFVFEIDDYEITLQKEIAEVENAFLKKVITLIFDGSSAVGTTKALSDITGDISKKRENQKTLRELRKLVRADLLESGFYESTFDRFAHLVTNPLTLLISGLVILGAVRFGVWPVLIPAAFILVFAALILSRRRTKKGYDALFHLEGFEEFLSVTGKDRFKFHNAPEKNPTQFLEYLPYAIAFGVDREWAKVFNDITIPDPEWYDSGSSGHFNASGFATSLGAFSTAFASSSGSSGSSGGGSAGGGSGGGGGGSW